MIVSHNELMAITNKAFLGMHRTCGEADEIANMVVNLQMVGLNGIHHFNKASQFLLQEKDCPVDIFVTKSGVLEVNLHGCSLACHLPAVIDYALEKMIGKQKLTIRLQHCHNRWLAYSELVKLANKGIACQAQWTNGSAPKRTLYVLNRGNVTPDIFLSNDNPEHLSADYPSSDHDMIIELSTRDFNVAKLSSDYTTHIDASSLNNAQDMAWDKGISVDDTEWEILKQTATAILVENSEQSQQGAGGVA